MDGRLCGKVQLESQSKQTLTYLFKHFKHQPHKMVKHTQIICRLFATNYLSMFDHFVGLALKRLILTSFIEIQKTLGIQLYHILKLLLITPKRYIV